MRKILLISFFLLSIIFTMPFFNMGYANLENTLELHAVSTPNVDVQPQEIVAEKATKDSKKAITLLTGKQVISIPLDEYLVGVLCAEMPASFPLEALRAQAVAARTYTMYKERIHQLNPSSSESHSGAIVCDCSSHCKAYLNLAENAQALWGNNAQKYTELIWEAVTSTDGEILVYKEEPIAAVFHSSSAERTENAEDIWGADVPYLVSVENPGASESPAYNGTVTVSVDMFIKTFKESYPTAELSDIPSEWFKNSLRSESGTILSVYVGDVKVSGNTIRSMFGLHSANFTIQTTDAEIIFSTIGYGHGIGLSQYGAKYMASQGSTYQEILKWYYTGVSISQFEQ